MALSSAKIAVTLFEKAIETHEKQIQLLDLVDYRDTNDADMQNAGNTQWQIVQQHAPIIDGIDISGLATGIVEETCPIALGTPKNDLFEQAVDEVRDMGYWERRGEVSGARQASELNRRIASLIANSGSLFYNTAAASGYDAIAQGMTILNERQKRRDEERCVILNDRDNLKYGQDLAGRQTLQGRPADTWKTGQIGRNIAGADIYSGSFLPSLSGNAAGNTTTTAALSDKPEGGTVNTATNTVTNIDYRTSTLTVVAVVNYAVGDRVKFTIGGVDVQSLGLEDKTPSGQAMTAVITALPNATSITVFPKLIAVNDAGLSALEKAYANIDTQVANGATVTKLNNYAGSKKVNLFFCKGAVQVTGGNAPVGLLNEFGGMKVLTDTMSNGQVMYMAYDGNLEKLSFTARLFTWYGETMLDPSAAGTFVTS